MKVRIRRTPAEREMDGVKLDKLAPGVVRNVPPSIASWLIAEGYAFTEMRTFDREGDRVISAHERLIARRRES